VEAFVVFQHAKERMAQRMDGVQLRRLAMSVWQYGLRIGDVDGSLKDHMLFLAGKSKKRGKGKSGERTIVANQKHIYVFGLIKDTPCLVTVIDLPPALWGATQFYQKLKLDRLAQEHGHVETV
jgi:hypothetical protein